MANVFRRQPQIGGDTNAWGTYLNAIIGDATGKYSSYLYNDSGTLKLSKGLIGIDNDTNIGLAIIDTITTITLTGTAGIWQKIELSVSGASVTLAATDIAGKTDPSVVPTEFTGAYDAEKAGYYIATNKRCIGVVFKNSSGVLDGIVNAENNILGYYGNSYLNTTHTAQIFWEKKQGVWKNYAEYQIGDWNMDSTSSVNVNHLLANWKKISAISVRIRDDNDQYYYPIDLYNASLMEGGVTYTSSSVINLMRLSPGAFASVIFDATGYNRGIIKVDINE